MTKQEILKSISDFFKQDIIPYDTVSSVVFDFEPINDYIASLRSKVKSETATGQLFYAFMKNIFEGEIKPEVNIEGRFIDFILHDKGTGNPICIELKPLFSYKDSKNALTRYDLNFRKHEIQIKNYLSKRNVEYVILTNVEHVYIFNRNALIKFEPFSSTTFVELIEDYLNTGNMWDVLRRREDNEFTHDLDTEFFQDLKKWYSEFSYVKMINNENFSHEEVVVLFLNKFIFIKTLEDYGLIPYRFIQDEFEKVDYRWGVKGNQQVFSNFFNVIEKFFQDFYNTELFDHYFWDYIDKNKSNLNTFRRVFELILGLDRWSSTFGKGLVHYNYRKINEDIFGKAYETWIAENRKDEGIYYTPASITVYMADLIVDSLFEQPVNELIAELNKSDLNEDVVKSLTETITSIKIIDSTSGSGSFLIKVLRRIYTHYERLKDSTEWASQFESKTLQNTPINVRIVDQFRKDMDFITGSELFLISKIIVRHIFGADKDERAIDTAKTNIWKEAVKLNPQIYNFRYLPEEKEHILPNLGMNFIKGDSLSDIDFELQISIISEKFKDEIIKLHLIRNSYLFDVFNPALLEEVSGIKEIIRNELKEKSEFDDALFFPLEFFYCFFDKQGNPLPNPQRGFDGIISNPPWEAIKPVKKEFAKQGKFEMDVIKFNKWFDLQIKDNDEFKAKWTLYTDNYKKYSQYLYSKYNRQSSGDPNFYKFFMERDFQIIKDNAFYCLLVPSGFQTDEGSNLLRKLLIEDFHLMELSSFENKGYQESDKKYKTKLFPEVHPQFKFSVVFAKKENLNGHNHKFKAKFYLHNPNDLYNNDFVHYDIEKIKQFSPTNISIMEFKSDKDYEICSKIRSENKSLSDYNIRLRREFDMTNDSNLFKSLQDLESHKGKPYLRLYEGKMIHQYNAHYSLPRYFINEEEACDILLRKVLHRIKSENKLNTEQVDTLEFDKSFKLDYQTYRLVYRAIGRSTDERTLISTIIPNNVFIGNSLIHNVNINYKISDSKIVTNEFKNYEIIYHMALLNSLTLNYYVRNKISANLNMHFIYEMPIAEAEVSLKNRLVELAFKLLYLSSNKSEFESLRQELGINILESDDSTMLRAEIEVIIARDLYGLTKDEWKHITSTFTYGEGSDTKAEMDDFIKASFDIWV
jgi:hypothetical protein